MLKQEGSAIQRVDQRTEKPIIQLEKLSRVYQMGKNQVWALRGVDLRIHSGELIAIMGPSGSGKSTLMNLLGCLDRPSGGNYYLDTIAVSSMSKAQLADVRNQKIGFVFQSFNLLTWMTAQANVELPLIYAGISREEREKRALWALKLVGLEARANHRPMEMSGGQQQRVAIARALVTRPAMILADEPTGNLDTKTSVQIMMVLQKLNQSGMTVVLVTHEPDIAQYCHRTVVLRDGKVREDRSNPHPLSALTQLAELSTASGKEAIQ
ncbi:ABC transporter ATP-binding protein [Tengunoibacter tsumagoiensis]|uniref:Macrolide export ATP-binding/permease protein MacB n=1 Tax=Tengunoibacter tsumagoiensis TaxID=2014871 RepID=A0A402AAQ8_9CHLR|nr:ABC transporter ATP-binding protein [Tengunoibacter tsumagoiensis]GCE16035.1 macrolide export ATP-binding/permease protein MacB [Tengunoibacter tsumagoiensis]